VVVFDNGFPTIPEELKIIRCNAICELLLISVRITPDKIIASSGIINPPI